MADEEGGQEQEKPLDVRVEELENLVKQLTQAPPRISTCFECSCGPCLECTTCRVCHICHVCHVCSICHICRVCSCFECGGCGPCAAR